MPTPKARPKTHTAHATANRSGPKGSTANKSTKTQTPHSSVPWTRPLGLVVVGPQGVGKTEFAASFPNAKVYYDTQESGILDLVSYKRIKPPQHEPEEITDFNQLCEIGARAGKLRNEGVETLVFDSLTGLERLCFDYHCEQYYDGDNSKSGFLAYYQGPKNAARVDWAGRFLESCQNAMNEGLNIVMIAHVQVKTHQNPEGADFDRYIPYLDKETWQFTHKWATAVLFYNYHFLVAEKKGDKKEKTPLTRKGKADASSLSRMLFTEWTPAYDAKNRMGLPPYIEAGDSGAETFRNFCNAIPK
jgi:hypothetical protein